MNATSKQLKRAARENLSGNYRITMGAFVTVMLLTSVVELPFSNLTNGAATPTLNYALYYIAEFLIAILSGVLEIGLLRMHLSISRKKDIKMTDVFSCFKSQTDRYILGYLISFVCSLICIAPALYIYFFCELTLGNLPLIIGLGLISLVATIFVNLALSLVFYVMLDNEDYGIIECFKVAINLMKGHKKRLLYIYFSFIGMWILVILSLGIGYLWFEPYRVQTYTMFYLDIIESKEEKEMG